MKKNFFLTKTFLIKTDFFEQKKKKSPFDKRKKLLKHENLLKQQKPF